MLSDDFLKLLRCPLNHGPLKNASPDLIQRLNEAIRAVRLSNRGGELISEELDGGLVDLDGTLVYPVHGGIPCLMVDEAIMLSQLAES